MYTTEQYLPYLLDGKTDEIFGLFNDEPVIDDPFADRVRGREQVQKFVQERQKWLAERQARIEHFRTTHKPNRTVVEYVLHLVVDGKPLPLPVAVVGEHPATSQLQEIHVYHSLWSLTGAHKVRHAFLEQREDVAVTDVVKRYQQALATGDVEAIVSCFEADGYFREPAGGDHIYRGTEKLREFMKWILGPGGIPIVHCTVTDDGVACAIEFNAVQYGPHPLIPQAGVAVYERGASGLLHAARIYDDVNVEAIAG